MSKESFESWAKEVAEYANTCCGRSDGYQEDVQALVMQKILAAVAWAYEDAAQACIEVREGGNGTPKDYEDTHEDGHLDGCNECEWEIRKRAKGAVSD